MEWEENSKPTCLHWKLQEFTVRLLDYADRGHSERDQKEERHGLAGSVEALQGTDQGLATGC